MAVDRHLLFAHWNVPLGQTSAVRDHKHCNMSLEWNLSHVMSFLILTMFTNGIDFVTSVNAVCYRVTKSVLWQALPTFASEALGIASDSFVTSSLVASIWAFPSSVTDTCTRKTGSVVTSEGFSRTTVCSAVFFIRSIFAVFHLVTHEVPWNTLTTPALECIVMTSCVLGVALGSWVWTVTNSISTDGPRIAHLTLERRSAWLSKGKQSNFSCARCIDGRMGWRLKDDWTGCWSRQRFTGCLVTGRSKSWATRTNRMAISVSVPVAWPERR